MERYKKLKNRRTSLKASTTRQLSQLDAYLNEQPPNKIVFENKRLLLQSNLTCLREVLKSMSEALVDLTFDQGFLDDRDAKARNACLFLVTSEGLSLTASAHKELFRKE